jgi:hypothetical protein
MKKINILPAGLLAVAALASLTAGAQAQTVTYNTGDLFLGFNEPGVSSDYVVDLGPESYFLTLAGSAGTTDITTSDYSGAGLGTISSDLSTVFGTSWYANNSTPGSNVQWGIVGASTNKRASSGVFGLPNDTLFFTVGELTPGSGSTGPTEKSTNAQDTLWNQITNFENGFSGQSDTSNSTVASVEASTLANNWSDANPGSNAFTSGLNIEQPTSGTYIGPTNSQLDLYELEPTDNGGTGTGKELGSFTLSSSGQLDFTSAAAVPEPSTYATIGIGAAFLLLFRRRTGKVVPG